MPVPGPGEVLVKVAACGICGTDVHILRGEYLGDYPVIPGHEFAGEVVAAGDLVSRFRVGDRVAVEPNIACDNCEACLSNRQNFCLNWQAVGVTRPGGMAEYVVAPQKAVFDIGSLSLMRPPSSSRSPVSCMVSREPGSALVTGSRFLVPDRSACFCCRLPLAEALPM